MCEAEEHQGVGAGWHSEQRFNDFWVLLVRTTAKYVSTAKYGNIGIFEGVQRKWMCENLKKNPLNIVSRYDPLDYHLNFLDFSSLQVIDMQKPWPNG